MRGRWGVECRNPDPGDHRSPFPPEPHPNLAEKQSAKSRRGNGERQKTRGRDLEKLKPQSQAQPCAPPFPEEPAKPQEFPFSLSPLSPDPQGTPRPPQGGGSYPSTERRRGSGDDGGRGVW